MRNKSFYPRTAILVCAIAAPSCVTYTPITAPPLPTRQAAQPAPTQPAQRIDPLPVPVPKPVPATVHLDISPTQEPRADEGGWQLIEEYAAAQRNIKDLNKKLEKLNTNR